MKHNRDIIVYLRSRKFVQNAKVRTKFCTNFSILYELWHFEPTLASYDLLDFLPLPYFLEAYIFLECIFFRGLIFFRNVYFLGV